MLLRELNSIREQVGAARRLTRPAPWEAPYGVLKRRTYRLVRLARSEGWLGAIRDEVTANAWVPSSPMFEANPFHWCLVALNDGQRVNLTRATRRRFANELLYADKHDVPELYLVGFIYQLGARFDIHERVQNFNEARMVSEIGRGQ
jgi:hypothetical protein